MRLSSLVVSALILATTWPAIAADDILRLKSGKFAVGKIVSVDESGVTLEQEGGVVKYDWGALVPLSEYEVRSDQLDPGTSAERATLAEFCLRHGLYPHARQEIAIARSLPDADAKLLAGLAEAVDQAEADETFAKVEQLVAEEAYDQALEEIRRFLRDAPPGDHTRRARQMVPDLIRRADSLALRVEEEAAEAKELEKREELSDKVKDLFEEVAKNREKAATSFAEGLRYHEIGNVTRAKKGYLEAEKTLLKNHSLLRKLQRIAREGVAAAKAEEEKEAIRGRLLQIYLGMARLYLEDRNYRRGVGYVNKALYLDPVNKEALDLRKEVDENRIRTSARRLTNTPGVRTTSGGSAK